MRQQWSYFLISLTIFLIWHITANLQYSLTHPEALIIALIIPPSLILFVSTIFFAIDLIRSYLPRSWDL